MSRPSEVGSWFNKKTFNKKTIQPQNLPLLRCGSQTPQSQRCGTGHPQWVLAYAFSVGVEKVDFKGEAPQGKPSAGAHIA
jgi:hypothetical protein